MHKLITALVVAMILGVLPTMSSARIALHGQSKVDLLNSYESRADEITPGPWEELHCGQVYLSSYSRFWAAIYGGGTALGAHGDAHSCLPGWSGGSIVHYVRGRWAGSYSLYGSGPPNNPTPYRLAHPCSAHGVPEKIFRDLFHGARCRP
jgi:hypothetical protein